MTENKKKDSSHSRDVVKIMEDLGRRARNKIERISADGRAGVIFAEIKDSEGNKTSKPGFRARVEQILYLARSGEAEEYYDFDVIQMALTVRAWDIWERLWREKHPDRVDDWDVGIDHSLMRIWREDVRRLFIEHHQEQVLVMKMREYKSRLAEGDLDKDTSRQIADFFYKAFHEVW
ncbi:MAG: hypothetical protein U9N73_01150 [Candidatus Auribacterota bacterium]|nr:hypothetical protein [Candidatus Auribacterota bacterium]